MALKLSMYTVANTARLMLGYIKLNIAAAAEYRVSFIIQCIGMVLNNMVAFFFWWLYFARFREIGGWGFEDMLLLWAVVSTAFGLAATLFGGGFQLASIITQGTLDYYLAFPHPPLLHILVSRTRISGWGDICFGLLTFTIAGKLDIQSVVLFIILIAISTAIFVGFLAVVGSLAFFIGNSETTSTQAQAGLIMFSTYPGSIFRGWAKILVLTVIPAAFVGHLPVQILQHQNPLLILWTLMFGVLIWLLAILSFKLGLKRYESGNLVVLHG